MLPDGTALGDVRYTLQTDRGDLLYVQSRGVRHGSAEVLARLGRGEEVDASEYTFRTATQIETAAPDLDWLNKGVFIGVGGRQADGRDLRDLPRPMSRRLSAGAARGASPLGKDTGAPPTRIASDEPSEGESDVSGWERLCLIRPTEPRKRASGT